MTIIERAIEKLKALEPEQQRYVADLLDRLADAGPQVIDISPEEQAIIDRALAEIDAGEIASDDEVATYRFRSRG